MSVQMEGSVLQSTVTKKDHVGISLRIRVSGY